MTDIRNTNEQLQREMHQFMHTVRSLSTEQFIEPIYEWSARDMVAHLIGWNRTGIDVADSLCKDEIPAVLDDPGDNFSKVNAAAVQRYDSTDAVELLRELELSYQELARHLFTIDPDDWTRSVMIGNLERPISIQLVIQAISNDYVNHRQEIESWLEPVRAG